MMFEMNLNCNIFKISFKFDIVKIFVGLVSYLSGRGVLVRVSNVIWKVWFLPPRTIYY